MKLTITILTLLFCRVLLPQSDSVIQYDWSDTEVIDEQSASFFEYLSDLFSDRIDLNTVTKNDLLDIPGFTNESAEKILQYRMENKHFYSVGELYLIPYIDKQLIRNSFSLFYVQNKNDELQLLRGKFHIKNEQYSFNELPENYAGSPTKHKMKLKIQHRENITADFIIEKDPGEQSLADHYGGYIQIHPGKTVTNIIAGNYILRSPAGLFFAAPYIPYIRQAAAPFQQAVKLRGFSGSEENKYLRGVSMTVALGEFTLLPFYSNNRYDGSYSGENISFNYSDGGYHRTKTEIQRKNQLSVISTGLTLNYQGNGIVSGGIILNGEKVSLSPYEQSSFFGGGNISFKLGGYSVISELISSGKKLNFTLHAGTKIKNNLPLGVYLRSLTDPKSPVYANPYRESSAGNGETGAGAYFTLNPFAIPIEILLDGFTMRNNELLVRTGGFRLYISTQKDISPSTTMRFGYTYRDKDLISSNITSTQFTQGLRDNFSLQFYSTLSNAFGMKNRIQFNRYQESGNSRTFGYALQTEFQYNQSESNGLLFGFTGFSSGSIETASYFSERTFLDYSQFRGLTGEGTSIYFSARVSIFKYAVTALRIGYENKKNTELSRDEKLTITAILNYEF